MLTVVTKFHNLNTFRYLIGGRLGGVLCLNVSWIKYPWCTLPLQLILNIQDLHCVLLRHNLPLSSATSPFWYIDGWAHAVAVLINGLNWDNTQKDYLGHKIFLCGRNDLLRTHVKHRVCEVSLHTLNPHVWAHCFLHWFSKNSLLTTHLATMNFASLSF